MSVYLDASILVALFTNDAHTDRANALLRRHTPIVIVSDFAAAEFASAIARRVRTKDLTARQANICFSNFDVWTVEAAARAQTTNADISSAASYLRRLDLTLRTPDAIHIAIARRIDASLFTFDEQMADAGHKLGVELLRA
ncbi:MAG: type II toxin-antitoxin system VapC family toxin [Bradyrhizobiaceae bacterium]|nr:type II toxin-antitoxin system VapC family toxin [Bradyrhizobiaceae bacterium]